MAGTLLLPGSGPSAIAGGPGVSQAQYAHVAMDADGDTFAVWQRYDNTKWVIESRYRPAGGSWRSVRTVADEAGEKPRVVADGDGTSSVVWGSSAGIRVARSTDGGAWSEPVTISAAGAAEPQIAGNNKGFVVVAWTRSDGTYSRIQASVRKPDGNWFGPITLSPAKQDAYTPAVVMDATGRATVVWRQDAATKEVQTSSRPRGGVWSPADTISEQGFESDRPAVGVDPGGNVIAVWQQDNGTNTRIQAARQPAGGAWGDPVFLSKDGRDAKDAQVALGKNGKAVVAWSRLDSSAWSRVQAVRRLQGGGWSQPATLSAADSHGSEPTLVMNPSGRALLTWRHQVDVDSFQVRSRRFLPSTGWTTNSPLSSVSAQASGPQPAITPSGAMAAVWLWFDGIRPRVQTSHRSATGSWSDPVFLSPISPPP